MEGDVIRTLRDNIAHIGHFHTAGNPGRNDPDENQKLYHPAIRQAIATTERGIGCSAARWGVIIARTLC